MNIKFNFDGSNFMAGFVLAVTMHAGVSSWWYLLVLFLLFDFEVKGMPYMKINYADGKLNVEKGFYK